MALEHVAAVVCFNRTTELLKTLDSIEKAFNSPKRVIIVCQLGCEPVENIVKNLSSDKYYKIYTSKKKDSESSRFLINRNVFTALSAAFELGADFVSLVEDDIEVHPQFFNFMAQINEEFMNDFFFKAANGFSGNSVLQECGEGFGKYRFGVGWGWSINKKNWRNLKRFWDGSEDRHWDGLIEPFMRSGFVVMPNHSLIINNGLIGNGTNSGADLALNQKIVSSYLSNKAFDQPHWVMNQINLSWREDCFEYLEPRSFAGILQQIISQGILILRPKTDDSSFYNKILAKFHALLFKLMASTQ
jgi:hypothetical protein